MSSPFQIGRKWLGLTDPTNGQIPVYSSSTGKVAWTTPSAGTGDMTKAVYDTDNDGKVNSAATADSATNADTLDGSHAAAFATSGHNHSGVYSPTGHTHAGTDITSAVANATDADTLDGSHASAFATAAHTHSTYTALSGLITDLAVWPGGYAGLSGSGVSYVYNNSRCEQWGYDLDRLNTLYGSGHWEIYLDVLVSRCASAMSFYFELGSCDDVAEASGTVIAETSVAATVGGTVGSSTLTFATLGPFTGGSLPSSGQHRFYFAEKSGATYTCYFQYLRAFAKYKA